MAVCVAMGLAVQGAVRYVPASADLCGPAVISMGRFKTLRARWPFRWCKQPFYWRSALSCGDSARWFPSSVMGLTLAAVMGMSVVGNLVVVPALLAGPLGSSCRLPYRRRRPTTLIRQTIRIRMCFRSNGKSMSQAAVGTRGIAKGVPVRFPMCGAMVPIRDSWPGIPAVQLERPVQSKRRCLTPASATQAACPVPDWLRTNAVAVCRPAARRPRPGLGKPDRQSCN